MRPIDQIGLYRLASAVIIQGLNDARNGDQAALYWLINEAPLWLDGIGLGHIQPETIKDRLEKKTILALEFKA
jgi:hypothetical protein